MATNEHSTSRRALILGLAGTPFLAGTMAAATCLPTDTSADAVILSAWRQSQAARIEYDDRGDDHSHDAALETAMDAAEEVILVTPATTRRGAAAKLWVALLHSAIPSAAHDAVTRGNYAAVYAMERELDFEAALILGAFRSLSQEG